MKLKNNREQKEELQNPIKSVFFTCAMRTSRHCARGIFFINTLKRIRKTKAFRSVGM